MSKKSKAKINNNLRSQHQKISRQYSNNSLSVQSIITVIVVILLVLLLFYILTLGILNKKSKSVVSSNTSIQYRQILAGESFSKKDKEYYVLFYDMNADDSDNNYNIVSNYSENNKDIPIYTVDLSEGLNKNCKGDEDNRDATNASELKISKTTLIKFEDGKISDYVTDNIEEYLKK